MIRSWFDKYDAVREYAEEFNDSRGVGYKCLICEREICCEGDGWSSRGIGFMNIAMQGHMDKHYRNSEIPDVAKCMRSI